MNIINIIRESKTRGASDIHIVCGLPVRIRINGSLVNYDYNVLTHEDCDDIARQLLGEKYKLLDSVGEVDAAGTFADNIRCRLNVFRQQGHISSAIRILFDKIPELETLGLPPICYEFAKYPRGIVLVTGETGSGKSTTLASLLNRINQTRAQHIITLEDPIEYIYRPDKCTINQREIGKDTESYESGLKAVLREDPDIILIGEMRTLDTIETALTAAETGHLVFATLHTNSAADSIDRIVSVFPGQRQQQIRLQLSRTLRAVLSQQLLPHASGQGRVLACEAMAPNSAIRAMIREGKTPQIESAIQTSAAEGNISMDNFLANLVRQGAISGNVAMDAAHDIDFLKKLIGMPNSSAPISRDRLIR
ncbi:MAG: PilT/PilU family type 4a pilus ATPase [Ruminococcaceae bacterium]|nr:PilT/PilU family type 4a pilus ATPase [Oscillospiraceae bacterium]